MINQFAIQCRRIQDSRLMLLLAFAVIPLGLLGCLDADGAGGTSAASLSGPHAAGFAGGSADIGKLHVNANTDELDLASGNAAVVHVTATPSTGGHPHGATINVSVDHGTLSVDGGPASSAVAVEITGSRAKGAANFWLDYTAASGYVGTVTISAWADVISGHVTGGDQLEVIDSGAGGGGGGGGGAPAFAMVSSTPMDSASAVAPWSTIDLTFNRDVDPSSATALTVVVSAIDPLFGFDIPVAGAVSTVGDTVTFTPFGWLPPMTVITVTATVGDLSSPQQFASPVFAFTTQ